MSEVIYRLMTKEDLDQVEKLEQECFVDPWNRAQLESELFVNPVNVIIVAETAGEIVGFNNFMITFNSATISQICVSKKHRNKGIATRLLREMEKCFAKEGDDEVETVTLEVRKSNEVALSLYVKDGYEIVVTKPKYYSDGEDAIYMVKRLLKWR